MDVEWCLTTHCLTFQSSGRWGVLWEVHSFWCPRSFSSSESCARKTWWVWPSHSMLSVVSRVAKRRDAFGKLPCYAMQLALSVIEVVLVSLHQLASFSLWQTLLVHPFIDPSPSVYPSSGRRGSSLSKEMRVFQGKIEVFPGQLGVVKSPPCSRSTPGGSTHLAIGIHRNASRRHPNHLR